MYNGTLGKLFNVFQTSICKMNVVSINQDDHDVTSERLQKLFSLSH